MPIDVEAKAPLIAALGGAVQGGVSGGVLWLVLNNGYRINGLGWLERMEWPVPGWVVFAVVGAVVGAVAGFLKQAGEGRRVEGLAETAAELGLDHAEEVGRGEVGAAGMPALADWSRGRNHHWGVVEGVTVDVVDATLVSESTDSEGGTSRRTTERTVVLVPAEDVPDLDLMAAGRGLRLLHALGVKGMAFDASAMATSDTAEVVARFDRAWVVSPGGGLAAEADAAVEASLRRLFPPRVMAELEPLAGCSAQCHGGRMAVWRGDGFRSAEGRRALVADAVALRRVLVEATARPATDDEVVPAPEGETAGRRVRRGAGLVVGGIAGLFLGFFGGFLGFSGIFFGGDLPFGVMAVLMPAMVFGGAALGGLIGVFVGSKAHRLMPIPDGVSAAALLGAPRGPSSGRRGGAAVTLGTFLGFLVGGAVGFGAVFGLLRLFGRDGPPLWLIFPVFFGCPIVGAAVGAVLGARWNAGRGG